MAAHLGPIRGLNRRELLARGGLGAALAGLPLSAFAAPPARTEPEKLVLTTSGGRAIETFRWKASERRGTVLFSHGALSSPRHYLPMVLPFVWDGFDVIAPLHVDSTEHPDRAKYEGLASFGARLEDLDRLAQEAGPGPVIAAGHSYGGLMALTLAGARPGPVATAPVRNVGIGCAVAYSPPPAMPGFAEGAAYRSLAVPTLVQTGTRDVPGFGPDAQKLDAWRGHLLAYEQAPRGRGHHALVLDEVDHYFGGLICNPDKPGPAQAQQLSLTSAVALAFVAGQVGRAGSRVPPLQRYMGRHGPAVLSRK